MSRDGSGTMTVDTMATASAVASSTTVNSIITDIANALTDSINKDGTKAWAANQSVGNNKFTSLGSGSARTDSINFGQVQDGKANWVDGGGTADAITATYSPAITALVDGQICFVRATAANATTTPTFAPNGLTARTIVKTGGVALAAGDIVGDGHELALRYDLTNTRWELLNPSVILTDYAALATANTFTAVQTIGVANAGTNTVTDVLAIRHTTSGTAAAGFGTGFVYRLEDGGGTTTDAASIDAVWVDATDTSEDSKISFKTMVAGVAKAEAAYIAQGLVVGAPTGTDKGTGTVNATGYYLNGVLKGPAELVTAQSVGTGTTYTISSATITQAYSRLVLTLNGVSHDNGSSRALQLEISGNNGSTWTTAFVISGSQSAATLLSGRIEIGNAAVSSGTRPIMCIVAENGTFGNSFVKTSDESVATGSINAIRLSLNGAGNFDAGTVSLVGYA